ncbi:MAG TPA: hypothetical protein DIC51_05115 [Coxiellaceae bacterium]|nr:hypothetical protein [Coxiellaceae bacterium]
MLLMTPNQLKADLSDIAVDQLSLTLAEKQALSGQDFSAFIGPIIDQLMQKQARAAVLAPVVGSINDFEGPELSPTGEQQLDAEVASVPGVPAGARLLQDDAASEEHEAMVVHRYEEQQQPLASEDDLARQELFQGPMAAPRQQQAPQPATGLQRVQPARDLFEQQSNLVSQMRNYLVLAAQVSFSLPMSTAYSILYKVVIVEITEIIQRSAKHESGSEFPEGFLLQESDKTALLAMINFLNENDKTFIGQCKSTYIGRFLTHYLAKENAVLAQKQNEEKEKWKETFTAEVLAATAKKTFEDSEKEAISETYLAQSAETDSPVQIPRAGGRAHGALIDDVNALLDDANKFLTQTKQPHEFNPLAMSKDFDELERYSRIALNLQRKLEQQKPGWFKRYRIKHHFFIFQSTIDQESNRQAALVRLNDVRVNCLGRDTRASFFEAQFKKLYGAPQLTTDDQRRIGLRFQAALVELDVTLPAKNGAMAEKLHVLFEDYRKELGLPQVDKMQGKRQGRATVTQVIKEMLEQDQVSGSLSRCAQSQKEAITRLQGANQRLKVAVEAVRIPDEGEIPQPRSLYAAATELRQLLAVSAERVDYSGPIGVVQAAINGANPDQLWERALKLAGERICAKIDEENSSVPSLFDNGEGLDKQWILAHQRHLAAIQDWCTVDNLKKAAKAIMCDLFEKEPTSTEGSSSSSTSSLKSCCTNAASRCQSQLEIINDRIKKLREGLAASIQKNLLANSEREKLSEDDQRFIASLHEALQSSGNANGEIKHNSAAYGAICDFFHDAKAQYPRLAVLSLRRLHENLEMQRQFQGLQRQITERQRFFEAQTPSVGSTKSDASTLDGYVDAKMSELGESADFLREEMRCQEIDRASVSSFSQYALRLPSSQSAVSAVNAALGYRLNGIWVGDDQKSLTEAQSPIGHMVYVLAYGIVVQQEEWVSCSKQYRREGNPPLRVEELQKIDVFQDYCHETYVRAMRCVLETLIPILTTAAEDAPEKLSEKVFASPPIESFLIKKYVDFLSKSLGKKKLLNEEADQAREFEKDYPFFAIKLRLEKGQEFFTRNGYFKNEELLGKIAQLRERLLTNEATCRAVQANIDGLKARKKELAKQSNGKTGRARQESAAAVDTIDQLIGTANKQSGDLQTEQKHLQEELTRLDQENKAVLLPKIPLRDILLKMHFYMQQFSLQRSRVPAERVSAALFLYENLAEDLSWGRNIKRQLEQLEAHAAQSAQPPRVTLTKQDFLSDAPLPTQLPSEGTQQDVQQQSVQLQVPQFSHLGDSLLQDDFWWMDFCDRKLSALTSDRQKRSEIAGKYRELHGNYHARFRYDDGEVSSGALLSACCGAARGQLLSDVLQASSDPVTLTPGRSLLNSALAKIVLPGDRGEGSLRGAANILEYVEKNPAAPIRALYHFFGIIAQGPQVLMTELTSTTTGSAIFWTEICPIINAWLDRAFRGEKGASIDQLRGILRSNYQLFTDERIWGGDGSFSGWAQKAIKGLVFVAPDRKAQASQQLALLVRMQYFGHMEMAEDFLHQLKVAMDEQGLMAAVPKLSSLHTHQRTQQATSTSVPIGDLAQQREKLADTLHDRLFGANGAASEGKGIPFAGMLLPRDRSSATTALLPAGSRAIDVLRQYRNQDAFGLLIEVNWGDAQVNVFKPHLKQIVLPELRNQWERLKQLAKLAKPKKIIRSISECGVVYEMLEALRELAAHCGETSVEFDKEWSIARSFIDQKSLMREIDGMIGNQARFGDDSVSTRLGFVKKSLGMDFFGAGGFFAIPGCFSQKILVGADWLDREIMPLIMKELVAVAVPSEATEPYSKTVALSLGMTEDHYNLLRQACSIRILLSELTSKTEKKAKDELRRRLVSFFVTLRGMVAEALKEYNEKDDSDQKQKDALITQVGRYLLFFTDGLDPRDAVSLRDSVDKVNPISIFVGLDEQEFGRVMDQLIELRVKTPLSLAQLSYQPAPSIDDDSVSDTDTSSVDEARSVSGASSVTSTATPSVGAAMRERTNAEQLTDAKSVSMHALKGLREGYFVFEKHEQKVELDLLSKRMKTLHQNTQYVLMQYVMAFKRSLPGGEGPTLQQVNAEAAELREGYRQFLESIQKEAYSQQFAQAISENETFIGEQEAKTNPLKKDYDEKLEVYRQMRADEVFKKVKALQSEHKPVDDALRQQYARAMEARRNLIAAKEAYDPAKQCLDLCHAALENLWLFRESLWYGEIYDILSRSQFGELPSKEMLEQIRALQTQAGNPFNVFDRVIAPWLGSVWIAKVAGETEKNKQGEEVTTPPVNKVTNVDEIERLRLLADILQPSAKDGKNYQQQIDARIDQTAIQGQLLQAVTPQASTSPSKREITSETLGRIKHTIEVVTPAVFGRIFIEKMVRGLNVDRNLQAAIIAGYFTLSADDQARLSELQTGDLIDRDIDALEGWLRNFGSKSESDISQIFGRLDFLIALQSPRRAWLTQRINDLLGKATSPVLCLTVTDRADFEAKTQRLQQLAEVSDRCGNGQDRPVARSFVFLDRILEGPMNLKVVQQIRCALFAARTPFESKRLLLQDILSRLIRLEVADRNGLVLNVFGIHIAQIVEQAMVIQPSVQKSKYIPNLWQIPFGFVQSVAGDNAKDALTVVTMIKEGISKIVERDVKAKIEAQKKEERERTAGSMLPPATPRKGGSSIAPPVTASAQLASPPHTPPVSASSSRAPSVSASVSGVSVPISGSLLGAFREAVIRQAVDFCKTNNISFRDLFLYCIGGTKQREELKGKCPLLAVIEEEPYEMMRFAIKGEKFPLGEKLYEFNAHRVKQAYDNAVESQRAQGSSSPLAVARVAARQQQQPIQRTQPQIAQVSIEIFDAINDRLPQNLRMGVPQVKKIQLSDLGGSILDSYTLEDKRDHLTALSAHLTAEVEKAKREQKAEESVVDGAGAETDEDDLSLSQAFSEEELDPVVEVFQVDTVARTLAGLMELRMLNPPQEVSCRVGEQFYESIERAVIASGRAKFVSTQADILKSVIPLNEILIMRSAVFARFGNTPFENRCINAVRHFAVTLQSPPDKGLTVGVVDGAALRAMKTELDAADEAARSTALTLPRRTPGRLLEETEIIAGMRMLLHDKDFSYTNLTIREYRGGARCIFCPPAVISNSAYTTSLSTCLHRALANAVVGQNHVLIPINVDNVHWTLIKIDFGKAHDNALKNVTAHWVDSLGDNPAANAEAAKVIQSVMGVAVPLQAERSPTGQQKDAVSCGYRVLGGMSYYLNEAQEKRVAAPSDVMKWTDELLTQYEGIRSGAEVLTRARTSGSKSQQEQAHREEMRQQQYSALLELTQQRVQPQQRRQSFSVPGLQPIAQEQATMSATAGQALVSQPVVPPTVDTVIQQLKSSVPQRVVSDNPNVAVIVYDSSHLLMTQATMQLMESQKVAKTTKLETVVLLEINKQRKVTRRDLTSSTWGTMLFDDLAQKNNPEGTFKRLVELYQKEEVKREQVYMAEEEDRQRKVQITEEQKHNLEVQADTMVGKKGTLPGLVRITYANQDNVLSLAQIVQVLIESKHLVVDVRAIANSLQNAGRNVMVISAKSEDSFNVACNVVAADTQPPILLYVTDQGQIQELQRDLSRTESLLLSQIKLKQMTRAEFQALGITLPNISQLTATAAGTTPSPASSSRPSSAGSSASSGSVDTAKLGSASALSPSGTPPDGKRRDQSSAAALGTALGKDLRGGNAKPPLTATAAAPVAPQAPGLTSGGQ